LPGLGTRGALRGERGEGDIRSGAGLCDGRAVPARAAAILVPPALGLEPFAVSLGGHSGTQAQRAATPPEEFRSREPGRAPECRLPVGGSPRSVARSLVTSPGG